MSCILWKSFNLCFSKFKCFPTAALSPPPTSAVDGDADEDHDFSTADKDPSILKNFNSLYDASYCSDLSTTKSTAFSSSSAAGDLFLSSSGDDGSDADHPVPDFTSAFASSRFFVSSPGCSNSIFEAPPPAAVEDSGAVVSGGVAVQTDSPDPYADFRESMVEMIEARDRTGVKADWEFLNELLLCYLTLNPKHTHKFIVGAFSDVIVSLVMPPPEAAAADDSCSKSHLRRRRATSHLSI